VSTSLNIPFGQFIRLTMLEFKVAHGGPPSPGAWEVEIERAHEAWHKFREQKKPARKVFTPPTPAEVEEYSRSLGWPLDGESWCLGYATKGWCTSGSAKMKDWKSAVKKWKRDGIRTKITPRSHQPSAPAAEPAGWQEFIDTHLVDHCRYRTGNQLGGTPWNRVDSTFKRLLLEEMAKAAP
jgi:hypothetical protein